MANKRIRKKWKKRELEKLILLETANKENAKRYYCLDCLKELKEDDQACSCGNQDYISGKGLTIDNGACICSCGNRSYLPKLVQPLGEATSHVFSCSSCGEYLVQMIFN